MASATYSDKLKIGDNVFKGNDKWKVLDKIDDKASGLQAYVIVNREEARMVLAVRGSGNPVLAIADKLISDITQGLIHVPGGKDAAADWKQDLNAIGRGQTPTQFTIAEKLVRQLQDQHGSLYSIECAGHSMGGGACAYAAANISGVHAVTVNPISTGALASKSSYLVDNYFIRNDAPDVAQRALQKDLTGWKYEINPQGPGTRPGSVANSTPSTLPPSLGVTPIDRHSVDHAVGGIATEMNLKTFEVNE